MFMILVIDDDQAFREAVVVILEMAGFDVLSAGNGRDGLALFAQNRGDIALILLDLTMPVMGGEEAMREILKLDPQAKIILSSGHHQGDIEREIAAGKPAGFLQKPYELEDLVAMVKQVIG